MTKAEAIKRIEEFGLHYAIDDLPHSAKTVEAFSMAIAALTQPERQTGTERQTGKWFKKYNPNYSPFDYSSEYIYTCSECGFDTTGEYNYCPKCGAKNKIDQEDIQDE